HHGAEPALRGGEERVRVRSLPADGGRRGEARVSRAAVAGVRDGGVSAYGDGAGDRRGRLARVGARREGVAADGVLCGVPVDGGGRKSGAATAFGGRGGAVRVEEVFGG